MSTTAFRLASAPRPRAFVRVAGPEAAPFLQRMVSNEVEALRPGTSCEALLLTAKGRLIAPLRILRRGDEEFLLLTEPELGARVAAELRRFRLAAKAEVEPEEHEVVLVLGEEPPEGAVRNDDYGVPACELLDEPPPAGARPAAEDELELLRIRARSPRWGRELDERVLPAEAGLDERAISFTKGCYPGQEPIARLHYRGHPNRSLRVLELEGDAVPAYDAEVRHDGKAVGRVTSAVATGESVVALGYVRTSVPADAEPSVDGRRARLH